MDMRTCVRTSPLVQAALKPLGTTASYANNYTMHMLAFVCAIELEATRMFACMLLIIISNGGGNRT